MKVLYFDCFAGASGDMILGALLDAGLPFDALRDALGSLAVDGWSIAAKRVNRAGIVATKFRVHETASGQVARTADVTGLDELSAPDHGPGHAHPHAHPHPVERAPASTNPTHAGHHSLRDIDAAIDRSSLASVAKERAKALFLRLGEAEAAIHGVPLDSIHLHEVGALDSIIDVVGAVFAFDWFAADRIVVSPINVGSGMVRSAHGLFPVPAPATVRLLGAAPVYASGAPGERLTPTGALLLSDYAASFGALPPMRVTAVGYGAGDRDPADSPNVLRVLVGEAEASVGATRVVLLECEIDDMNPQLYGPLMDRLYTAGAFEVCYTSVQMKKGRPGTRVTIVAPPEARGALADVVFRETTTLGLRHQEVARECLAREMITVASRFGDVRFKLARRADGGLLNAQPEFDDLARLAADHAVAVKEVQAAAFQAWFDHQRRTSL